MWPKVFAQLVEILPHVARLIPMADTFFTSKAANDKTSQNAIVTLAEDVRSSLGKVNAAHESLYRQLQDQGTQIAAAADDLRQTRTIIEGHAERVTRLEKEVTSLGLWAKLAVSLLAIVILLLIAILVRR